MYLDFEELPKEVLFEIGRCLEREDISRYSRVCKGVHAATVPLLFSKLRIPFSVRDNDWIETAMKSVDPDTWQHVKELRMAVFLPSNRATLKLSRPKGNSSKARDYRTMWRSFFCLFGPLTQLSITIRDSSESPEAAHAISKSSHWLDYSGLLQGSESLYELIPASRLHFGLACSRHNHSYSDFIQRMLAPLVSYPEITVQLSLAPENDEMESPGTVQLGKLISSSWVKRLSVETGSQLHLLPFQNISTLSLLLKTETITAKFLQHFELASCSIQILRITELDLPEINNTVLRTTIALSKLETIVADGFTVSTLAQLAKLSPMPALGRVAVHLDCRDPEDLEYEHFYNSIMVSLQSLVRLNENLPKHCQADKRIYRIYVEGDLEELGNYCDVLSSLASTSALMLMMTCLFKHPGPLSSLGETDAPPYCDAKALAAAFPPDIRSSIKSLHIKLDPETISRPLGGQDMAFPNLTDLTVSVPEKNTKWSTRVVHQLFSSLSLPKLNHLLLESEAKRSVNARYVEMLEIFLPLWPALRQLELETSGRGNYEPELNVSALKAACEANSTNFTKR